MDTLPERPATPNVKVNPFDFTMNTTPDMEYSDDGGETWTLCEDSPNVENRQGATLLIRIAATDDSFRSETCTVIVPVRGAAPAPVIDNATEILNSTAAMEYSCDNGETWISCTDSMSLSDLTGEALLIRYACDGTNPASNNAFVTVPARNPTPNVSISTATERLTATGTHPEYRTENGWTEIPTDGLNVSDLCGQEVAVRERYDTEHFASLPVMTTVPKRGAKPDLTIDRDKQIINTTGDIEFSADGGVTWVKCDLDMDVSDLTGQTILVRRAANDYEFASDPVEVKIPNHTENPDVKLDTTSETVNTTPDMDYSTDGGRTWNPCTEPLDVSDLTGQAIITRNHGDENSFPSSGVEVKIPARRDAPHVEVDGAAKAVTSASGTEFSIDNGQTWAALTGALNTKDYRGKTLLFRYPASADDFVSRSVVVLISNNPDAPVLVFDPNTETINTTPDVEYSDDGGKTWKPCPEPLDVSDLDGKEILIRYPGKDGVPPSEAISVRIPARRAAPDVGHTDETAKGKNDGSLTDTNKTMEYRISGGKWISIAGKIVKNLAPDSYEVRYKATISEMASKIQKVKIKQGSIGSDITNNVNSGNNSSDNNSISGSGSKLSLLNRADHFAYIVGRTTTQAAPTADITRAEVASILYRLLTDKAKSVYGTNINHFKDVPTNAWYSTAVSTLANLGVISGYPDGTFGPNKNISRAELASILARFCGNSNTQTADKFTDISESWARKFINQAAAAGLVYGYENGTFRPNQNITRAETIAMVNRILNRKASADAVVTGYKTFTDVPAGKWFYWDIVEASNAHNFTMSNSSEKWTALK